ncbi:uncharacterized protein [Eurosta solidaginis]|uniref:uncharacterized protein n=1 Tax=Eurosta solidaginis TaxID=178769 RepID=UPI0035306CCC
MPSSGHVSNIAELSEEEKQNALQILTDMFNCHPDEQLKSICESLSWNVERCIDFLINGNDQDHIETQRNSGAIPKQNKIMEDNTPIRDNLKKRQPLNGYNHLKSNINQKAAFENNNAEQRIGELISNGAKVMVIMRGVPGSGKTCLAKNLIERYVSLNEQYTIHDFIFSSDDFFYKSSGRYKWQGCLLDQAHQFNQQRVKERAQAGWSPIFVDNTNVKLWEMLYYAQVAVQNGYIIELLEPKTSWRKSANKLSQKTKHGVPAEKIQLMLNNFEKGTVHDLLKMLNTTKYTVTLPQMRSIPPIQLKHQDAETKEMFEMYKPDSSFENNSNETEGIVPENNCPSKGGNAPKPQRDRSASKLKTTSVTTELESPSPIETTNKHQVVEINETNIWKPHEKEINKFWNSEMTTSHTMMQTHECPRKSILDLLREGVSEGSSPQKNNEVNDKALQSSRNFERHSLNCPNENKIFASLRQIYPNKELASLWDLFVKCNGDIDWTVDLLLREEELMTAPSSQCFEMIPEIVDDFRCSCCSQRNVADASNCTEIIPTPVVTSLRIGIKPQRQRSRAMRINQRSNTGLREITELIANRFVLDGEQFSPHVRKLREIREKLRDPPEKLCTNTETQTDPINDVDPIDDNADGELNEIIEVNLGDDLVKQLKNLFQDEMTSLVERLPDNPLVNVFMPRSLAKDLYMLWVESAYNQLEEQRQKTSREDADFARLLKNPKYENYKESPGNIEELLDMELAWKIYKNDHESEIQRAINTQQLYRPNDLAEHLTQLKLCENFPNIPRETLIEILSAHANNYDETVRVLKIMTQPVEDLQQELLDCTLKEREMYEEQLLNTNIIRFSDDRTSRAPLQPDDAKRKALHDFEEMRNLAAHHCQLKAECYQKAKEAIQKGNSAVAVYYSQVANLHKMKLDMYNHRAANCIMDVHKYTQNNPELLDLHYLHVMEAIGCLDLFLDRHITGLRAASRTYKHIFIITGRGLHSTGGVSTIKNKVKTRLKERNLRWTEVNPGLLKVKIFSASRHSKNI